MSLNRYIKASPGTEKKRVLDLLGADMLLMGKVALPTMFQVKSPTFHREIVTDLQNLGLDKLNFIAPRGHAKSSIIACLYPLHHIFYEDKPKLIVLCSRTQGHAIRLLQTIKNALDYSVSLRQLYGYWGEHSARVWKNDQVVLKDGTMIIALGAGQMIVGLKHGDQRPTLIILDDPEDLNNTKTAEAMDANLRWLLQSVVPARDPLRGRVIVVGTPQHERCMVEKLKVTQGWTTRWYDAEADPVNKIPLWPEWWSWEKLKAEEAQFESIGRLSGYYREFRCKITGDEDQLFKPDYLQYYRGYLMIDHGEAFIHITELKGKVLEQPLIKPVNVFMGVDPASSTQQTADFSAIVALAMDKERNRYILPYTNRRVTPMALGEAIFTSFEKYRPIKSRIESVGYQEMLRQWLKEESEKRNMFIAGLDIKEIPRTAKSKRLEQLEPMFYQKRVFIQPEMKELEDQLLLYPRGAHDDLLDALFYACKGNFPPFHEYTGRQMKKIGERRNEEEQEVGESWRLA